MSEQVPERDVPGPDVPEPTGHEAIDTALASLSELDERPVTDHVATYDEIHQVLRTTLADAGRSDSGQSDP